MEVKNRLSVDAIIGMAIFAVVLVVYVVTACPTIYPGPSAKAVCEVKGVGLAPPSVHPIWVILGRLMVPLSSNAAYVLNLLSALFGAATIALLYAVLSQFSHTRTAEEEARYQTQPHLRQVAALSGALLVAFSRPFWEGSVVAGTDTLNTFFLVLIVFLLARYVKTSKSRYAIGFGLVYGLAITNYATLFLLAPIFVVFLLVRCRALLDDPVAMVLMVVLFGVGLLPSLYGPRAYTLQAKDYVVQAKTFGLALSRFVDSYFRSMKELFLQKNTLHDWIFWLFLPTFVPVLFFMMKRGEYERGSPTATRLTYLVRYAFVLLFTLGGLGYVWGYRVGPVGMAGLDYLRHSRYLGSYVVVGGWFSYIVGYWMILGTGKFKPTGTDAEPKLKYRRIGYLAGVVAALALPAAGLVMNYAKSTKRSAKYAEHFAEGVLRSSPRNAIIIVSGDPFFGSIGAPLRYFESEGEGSSTGEGRTIVDLNAAYFDFYTQKSVETARYLAETIFGREVAEPRKYFVPESPFGEVYDGIVRCEALRALEKGERPRPICGLVNNFFLSPLRGGNDVMNRDFRAEPRGLVYVYRSKLEYRDRSKVIKENVRLWKELWSSLGISDEEVRRERRSEVEDNILGEYSKSANDFGVFCQLAGELDLAEKYYNRALALSPENSSALRNQATIMARKGEKELAGKLMGKYTRLIKKREQRERDFVRNFGFAIDVNRVLRMESDLAAQKGAKVGARRLGILRLAAEMMPENATVRERIGDLLLSSGAAFSVQEARSEYVAALERRDRKDREARKRILTKLAGVYMRLGRNSEAEEFFKKAVDADGASAKLNLIKFYLTTSQKASEVKRLATSILERATADEDEEKRLAPDKKRAAMMMAKALLKWDGAEKAEEFVEEYVGAHPQEADILLTLAAQLRSDARNDALTTWLIEKHVELVKDLPVSWLPQCAEVYVRQKRYDVVIGMKAPTASGPSMDLASFYYFRGEAYEALGKSEEAQKSYERARSLLPERYGNLGVVLANNLSWLYFKSGKKEARELAEEAMAADPANSVVWDTYGWILYKTGGDFEKAFGLIEASHLANPDVGMIGEHYAELLTKKGLKERAKEVLKKDY